SLSPSIIDQARDMAKLAQSLPLSIALEQFRTPPELLAYKLLNVHDFEFMQQPTYLAAFNHAYAMSDFISQSARIDRALRDATHALTLAGIPNFETLAAYRHFLDAASLTLPRWPRMRLLTAAEKRRQVRTRLKKNAEPPHVRRAKSLVHHYELTLREILDDVMAGAFGEDWAETRLPACGCNDLLRRWRERGGDVLDYADYAHYAKIMSDPEHFTAVFHVEFDDPETVAALMRKAGP